VSTRDEQIEALAELMVAQPFPKPTIQLARSYARAMYDAGWRRIELEPAERMALTVARVQVERDGHPMPNVGAACVLALARLTE
jgi:hypothetical protein